MRYFTAESYKVVVKDSGGSTIYTRDDIDPAVPLGSGVLAIANGGTGASVAATALSNLGGATAAEVADVAADVAALAGAASSSEKTHIATGTTAQRPASPTEGDVRRNTTLTTFEGYNGSAWVNFAVLPTAQTDPSATDSAEGFIEIATAAEQVTGTDTVRAVVPGRQQNHESACKAWGTFAGATGTIEDSYNVTSVVRDSEGDYTVTIANDFANANYAILLSCLHSADRVLRVVTQAAGTFTIKSAARSDGSDADPTSVHFACFGTLA
jgi:hypothetical protein